MSWRVLLDPSRRLALAAAFAALSVAPVHGQALLPPNASATARASGAEQVVVGRVTSVTPVWRDNEFGDRLIVSVVHVVVDETLKGIPQPAVDVEVEGGTIGTLTLRVSDLDTFSAGDRAVFYLRHNHRGGFVPHLRGLGLQKLDRAGRTRDSGESLDQVRSDVRRGAGRGR
jgi:hypothetical protein